MTPISPLPSRVAPALGDFAAVVRVGVDERHLGVDARHDLARRHDVVHAPAVGGADVHVLDEAHDVAGAAEAPRHRHDRALVHAALDHHVDLERREPRCGRGVDALEHLGDREVDVVHRAEGRVVERVEAHGDARQAGRAEVARLAREQRAVGRERDVEVVAEARSISINRSSLRRSSGSPPVSRSLRTPSATNARGEARDLLEREQRRRAAGTDSRGRTRPSACSTRNGSCSGR